jgi:hypothetical protein
VSSARVNLLITHLRLLPSQRAKHRSVQHPVSSFDIEYCDLLANPQRYDRRIVRFDAIMLANHGYEPLNDNVMLGTPVCEHQLVVNTGFHLNSLTCPAVLANLDSLLMRYDPVYPRKNAKVRVVGRFFSSKDIILRGVGGWWQSERFTIIAIERAASIDEDN